MYANSSGHPPVKIAAVVSILVLLIVLMLAAFATEYLLMFGWIAVPLSITALGVAVVTAQGKG